MTSDRNVFHHRAAALAMLVLSATGAACFVDNEYPLTEDFGVCRAAPGENSAGGETGDSAPIGLLSYYEHAKPILDAKCAGGCHIDGGIAPFALDTYDQTLTARDSMRAAIVSGQMPPWQPDDCCNHYRYDRSLSDAERDTLLAWLDQGQLLGDPADEGPPLEVDSGGLSRVDVVTTMPEPFTPRPLIGRDELRCFLLDWPVDHDTFVTGINVVPGDRSVVHHVVVAMVPDDVARDLAERDGADGRPGWDCYGDIGADFRSINIVGGWAPGYQGTEFPDGLGKAVPAGSRVVLNMHYDTGRGTPADQTSVEFMTTDTPVREMTGSAVMNPLWLVGDGMSIRAGDPDAMTYFSWDPTALTGNKPFAIYAVNIHMHELGTIGRLAVLRGDGSTECLLNITRWDFDWIGEYYLEEPVILYPGDQLFVECHWDNTAGNQKIVDG
ncbi:MAG: hypothetical protein AAGC55_21915, partial [Myxococcota bacterium]